MNIHKTLIAAICLSAAMLAPGCANKYAQNHIGNGRYEQEKMLVAVLPFQGVSESPGSGLIVADVMANELYSLGGYTLITPELMAARLAPREGEALAPEEAGRLVGAPLILTGRVTEYTYKSGVGEQPAAAITARLIECKSGRVIWSATRARTGSAAWFQEDSLGLLTSRICHDLALSLNGEAAKYGYGSSEDDYTVSRYPLPAKPAAANASVSASPAASTPASAVTSAPVGVSPSAAAPAPVGTPVPAADLAPTPVTLSPLPQTASPAPQASVTATTPFGEASVTASQPQIPARNQPQGVAADAAPGNDFQYTAPQIPAPAPAPSTNVGTSGATTENGTNKLDGGGDGTNNVLLNKNNSSSQSQVFVFPEGALWDA